MCVRRTLELSERPSTARPCPAPQSGRRVEHQVERGSMSVLMTGLLVLCGVLTLAVARLGGAVVERSSAQVAADAAALAGARFGQSDATSMASANGAVMTSFFAAASPDGSVEVQVTVALRGATASARARYVPPPPPPTIPDTTIPDTTIAVLEPDTVPPTGDTTIPTGDD